jgi:RNA polymerase sigma-70 factor (ECF subfamily)
LPPVNEQSLIERAQQGETDAFNTLVETHQDLVFSVTLRMVRNRASAEDLTQETFISAWRAIRSFRGGTPGNQSPRAGTESEDARTTAPARLANPFRAWLLRIARNATYDHLRRAGRRVEMSIEDDAVTFAESLPSAERGPEEWALSGELGRAISVGLGGLSPDQRMAVVLVDIEGQSYEEAAAAMETNIGTVKSRLNRGRSKLRDFLRRTPELLPAHLRLEDKE